MTQDWNERSPRWAGVRSDYINVDETRVSMLRADGPAGGRGCPQLLIHGLGGSATNWLDVIPALAGHGPVVAVDLPGFGLTEPVAPATASLVDQVAFLDRLLDRLGWEQAVVHGNSMGGTLALMLAGLAPQKVARLVLACPALPAPRAVMHRTAPGTLLRFAPFAVPGLGRLAMRLGNRLPIDQYADEIARYVHAAPERVSPESTAVGIEDLVHGRDLPWRQSGFVVAARSLVHTLLSPREMFEHIDGAQMPVLIVWGDADQLVGSQVIDHLLERRPDWELTVLDATGHVPMLEAPDRYSDAVTAWLPAPTDRSSTAELQAA